MFTRAFTFFSVGVYENLIDTFPLYSINKFDPWFYPSRCVCARNFFWFFFWSIVKKRKGVFLSVLCGALCGVSYYVSTRSSPVRFVNEISNYYNRPGTDVCGVFFLFVCYKTLLLNFNWIEFGFFLFRVFTCEEEKKTRRRTVFIVSGLFFFLLSSNVDA